MDAGYYLRPYFLLYSIRVTTNVDTTAKHNAAKLPGFSSNIEPYLEPASIAAVKAKIAIGITTNATLMKRFLQNLITKVNNTITIRSEITTPNILNPLF